MHLRHFTRALLRLWWIVALVTLIVGAIEAEQLTRIPQTYVTHQQFVVTALPTDAQPSASAFLAQRSTFDAAQELAAHNVFHTALFEQALLNYLRVAGNALPGASAAAAGNAVTVSATSNRLEVTVRWGTAAGATYLMDAVSWELQSLQSSVHAPSQLQATYSIASSEAATPPVADTAQIGARREQALIKVVLACATGIVIASLAALLSPSLAGEARRLRGTLPNYDDARAAAT